MNTGASGWIDRWRFWWLLLAVLFVAPVGYAGPLGFVPLVIIPAVALIPVLRFRSSPWVFLSLLALLSWALIAWAWSPVAPAWSVARIVEDLGGSVGLKLALQLPLYAVFVIAADRMRPMGARAITVVLAAAIAVLTAALVFEGATNAALYRAIQPSMRPDLAFRNAGQGVFVVAVLFWPMAGVLMRRMHGGGLFAACLGLAVVVASVLLGLAAAGAAVLAGGLAFAAFRLAPRAAAWLASLSVTAFSLAAPWLVQWLPTGGGQPASWSARNVIWRFVSGRIAERPWFGWGLDASRTFGGPVPLHPHDAPLQIRAELGWPGVLLFALFWAVVFWSCGRVARQDRLVGAAWAAAAAAYFVIGALSFGVWQEWWLALGAFTFAAALLLRRGWTDGAAKPPELASLQSIA